MHKVTILALDNFIIFDLAISADIFSMAKCRAGENLYETSVCGHTKTVSGPLFDMKISDDLSYLERADTIIVPGISNTENPVEPGVLEALRKAAGRGARIASICTGAFVLAEAGLLDGLRATTHWRMIDDFTERYPRIQVEPDVLFIDNGSILTSAGVASGIDLCLHMIRLDYGSIAAADVADNIVMPLEREGTQSQRIKHNVPTSKDNLNGILVWLMENIDEEISVDQIARQFHLSPRTLNRWFREQTGTTPLQWILAAKVRHAQKLLESTSLSIEDVSSITGFNSASTFRERFQRIVGVSPSIWRNTYRKGSLKIGNR